ncbi:MAG: hypothetical protein WCB31_10265 [Nitrososphaeraceae archaeon]
MDEIKTEYELCIKEPHEYERKVNSISNLLHLKGNKRLIDTDCPVLIVGNYEIAPIVMFGINPEYSSNNNPTEDREARISCERYLQLYKNFYRYFESNRFESPYYNALKYLISGLIKTDIPHEQKWKFFDRYLINMELIPYHSTGITFPAFLSRSQSKYLLPRFQNSLDFIIKFRPKLFIFNGNPWYILLIKNKIIKNFDKVSLTKKFSDIVDDIVQI